MVIGSNNLVKEMLRPEENWSTADVDRGREVQRKCDFIVYVGIGQSSPRKVLFRGDHAEPFSAKELPP